MNKTVAAVTIQESSSELEGNKAGSDFNYLSKGNWSHTKKALESYLMTQGVRPQSYTAELIMFMERSFQGKYRKNERCHYQRITPWPNRVGDSLSEKLTRCKDKETFKNRFQTIGATAKLRREHFDNGVISPKDFQGRLYLRLIDTQRNNVMWFFRNDDFVDAFIGAALNYYSEKMLGLKKIPAAPMGNPGVGPGGKPELIYLENPKSLLTIKESELQTEKNKKKVSLTLVHSSLTGKSHLHSPGEENLISNSGMKASSGDAPHSWGGAKPVKPNQNVGRIIYGQWRGSVLAHHPELCISEKPTGQEIGQAKAFYEKYMEFFPTTPFADFINHVVERWIGATKALNSDGVWQTFGRYPEIRDLLLHASKILSWYRLNAFPKKTDTTKGGALSDAAPPDIPPETKENPVPPVPFAGCSRVTEAGRTFIKHEPESLEYQFVSFESLGMKFGGGISKVLWEKLKTLSKNIAASELRINELRELPADEFQKYCC